MIPEIRILYSAKFQPASIHNALKDRHCCKRLIFSNKTDSLIKEKSLIIGAPEIALPGTERNKAMLKRITEEKIPSPAYNLFEIALQNKISVLEEIEKSQQEKSEVREDNNNIIESEISANRKLD